MLRLNLFWIFITILAVTIEFVVLKVILDELNQTKNSKITVIISLMISISIVSILTLVEFSVYIELTLNIIIMCIFYMYNYKIRFNKCLFVSLIYNMIIIGLEAVIASIIVMTNSISDMNNLLYVNKFRLELIIFCKSLLVSLIPIVKSLGIDLNMRLKEYIYIIIPVIGNIISIIVIFSFIFKYEHINDVESIIIIIVSIILCASSLSLIGIMSSIIKDNKLKLENETIKQKVEMQYKYYSMMQEISLKIRKLYHDMNNHMICIQSIYGKDKIVDKYIKDINEQLKDCKLSFNTNNLILDVILNEKYITCKNNSIEFISDINFSMCKFIEMADVCSIFSNMLDNAIEACIKIEDVDIKRFIKLKGTSLNDFFIIKCKNIKSNKFDKNNIMTDKQDKFLHGIGISSIKKSVEKYNGNVEINTSENEFTMIIYIPLI
ncbi:ATP-binding protein [Clostridioides difficile]|nr:sensor histidine kinase [Clostridioides difficile]MDN9636575.1 ATP-binding protein [Clostridioides difficile]